MRRLRRGQAMVETVLAVLVVSFAFLALFRLSYLLTGKILLQHAAMRVARARAVGLNDYMCRKSARVAVIPVAGERLWPAGEEFDAGLELARIPEYLASENDAYARGVLEYARWSDLRVEPGDGRGASVSMGFDLFDGAWTFDLGGEAGVEANHTYYMNDAGR